MLYFAIQISHYIRLILNHILKTCLEWDQRVLMTLIDPDNPVFNIDVQQEEDELFISIHLKVNLSTPSLSAYTGYDSHDAKQSLFLMIQAGGTGGPIKIWPIPEGYDAKNPSMKPHELTIDDKGGKEYFMDIRMPKVNNANKK